MMTTRYRQDRLHSALLGATLRSYRQWEQVWRQFHLLNLHVLHCLVHQYLPVPVGIVRGVLVVLRNIPTFTTAE